MFFRVHTNRTKIDTKSYPGAPRDHLGSPGTSQERPCSPQEATREPPGATPGRPGSAQGPSQVRLGEPKGRPGDTEGRPESPKSIRDRLQERRSIAFSCALLREPCGKLFRSIFQRRLANRAQEREQRMCVSYRACQSKRRFGRFASRPRQRRFCCRFRTIKQE
jgi:hypothetical protein